jgi:glutamine amidotransferase
MCQLFAISARLPLEITPLLTEFFTHAKENPHGWGYASFEGQEHRVVRFAERADTGLEAAGFLSHGNIASEALAHIRYATVGQVEPANCHPFGATDASGRRWTLAHKGTIFDYAPLNPYFEVQEGTTDSERLLLYLLDWINAATEKKGAPLEVEERFAVFSYLVEVVSPGNCISLIVHDSDRFFVYSNYAGGLNVLIWSGGTLLCTSRLASAQALAEVQVGTGILTPAEVAAGILAEAAPAQTTAPVSQPVLVCCPAQASWQFDGAQPVRYDDDARRPAQASWQPLALCTPLSYHQGMLALRGAAAGEQYFDREEDTRYLYQDYAAL